MSKEIRELAAQMIFAIDCEDEEIPEIDGLGAIEVMEHFRDIADAYLAEHPADDDEPVTEEWLRSAGFWDRGDSDLCSPPDRHEDGVKRCVWMLIYQGNWREYPRSLERWGLSFSGCQSNLGYDLKTRGDVRRLCKALGVELRP